MNIGIFWYFKNQVFGIAHDFYQSDQDSLGLIDSIYTHVEYWEVLKSKHAELCAFEYEEIPRGRVIYHAKIEKSFVYMDTKLFKKQVAIQIADFFELDFESIVWKKDPHYKT